MTDDSTLRGSIEREVLGSDAVPKTASPTLVDKIERPGKSRQKSYLMDLRIHSPASLGYLSVGGIDTAPALVRLAKVKGLDMIAVTDFYSAAYIDRVIQAARGTQLTVLPGVMIRCKIGICDDASLACLFPESFGGEQVQRFLSMLEVPASVAGDKRFLVKKNFDEILAALTTLEGLAIPSRLDKTPHRLSAIPILVNDYGFRAFDLAYPDSARYFKTHWPKTKFNLFCFSNANALAQVGSRMAKVKLSTGGFAGLQGLVSRELPAR